MILHAGTPHRELSLAADARLNNATRVSVVAVWRSGVCVERAAEVHE